MEKLSEKDLWLKDMTLIEKILGRSNISTEKHFAENNEYYTLYDYIINITS